MQTGLSEFPVILRSQQTETRPSWTDSAPCFAALVANSCNTIDTAWPAFALSVTSGPSIAVLVPVA